MHNGHHFILFLEITHELLVKVLWELVKWESIIVGTELGVFYPFLFEILFELLICARFRLDFSPIFHYDFFFNCSIEMVFNDWINPVVVLEGQRTCSFTENDSLRDLYLVTILKLQSKQSFLNPDNLKEYYTIQWALH
jgi:hypothetical protein